MHVRTSISNVTVWFALLVACIMSVPLILYAPRDQMFELMNALAFACGAGTAVGHFPAALAAMRMPYKDLTAGQILSTGIFLSSMGVMGVFGARWIWRILDRPSWASDHGMVAFSLWVFVLGYMMCFATVGARDGRMPMSAYQGAALTVFLAALISTVLVTFLSPPN